MEINIQTETKLGMISCSIRQKKSLLCEVHANQQVSITLEKGIPYRLEWTVQSMQAGERFLLQARVTPPNSGFEDFVFDRTYPKPGKDGGGFDFTLK